MSARPLITHEIGSLAKPSWRVKPFMGRAIEEKDIEEAKKWGQKLEIKETERLIELLKKKANFTDQEKAELLKFSSLFGTRFFEKAGLDLVWDGEQQRVEMYEFPVSQMDGFHFHGHVRSFDNKYYKRASCDKTPGFQKPFHVDEYKQIASLAKNAVKIPVTGAYTLVDWSYDAHYLKNVMPGAQNVQKQRLEAREQFLTDVSRNVIYPNLKALYEAGARYLQIDEPAATTKRDEIGPFIDSVRESIGDLAGKAFFTVHICFSVYSRLFPQINELQGILDEVHLEYANRDSRELGRNSKVRLGYEILDQLKDTDFVVGLGVLDIHTDFIESPALVRDRILYAVDKIGDPSRIMVTPDCGLRTRTWDVSFKKLQNMVEGKRLAEKELGI